MSRIAFVLVVLAAVGLSGCCKSDDAFRPEPGDLLFQDLDLGPLCDAIEKVTEGCGGADFSHVGIASPNNDGSVVVIEAVPDGVLTTPLDAFLERSLDADGNPKVLVGRLRPEYRRLIPPALDAARALTGRQYDGVFAIDNDRYYCSELVYEAFRKADDGKPLFELAPMTFRDPDTGATMPAWLDYFNDLKTPVPEGEPGINPGGISRSSAIEIVHAYGKPSGWRGAP